MTPVGPVANHPVVYNPSDTLKCTFRATPELSSNGMSSSILTDLYPTLFTIRSQSMSSVRSVGIDWAVKSASASSLTRSLTPFASKSPKISEGERKNTGLNTRSSAFDDPSLRDFSINSVRRFLGLGKFGTRFSTPVKSSGRHVDRQPCNLSISRSSFIVYAACNGPRLPIRWTTLTFDADNFSSAYWVMSVFCGWNYTFIVSRRKCYSFDYSWDISWVKNNRNTIYNKQNCFLIGFNAVYLQ